MQFKPQIFIRSDGNSSIGLGHLIRCKSIADFMKNDYHVTFITKDIPDSFRIILESDNINYQEINKEEDFFKLISFNVIVVLDGYHFNTDYQKQIKIRGAKLICIDDLHEIEFVADLIINHSPGIKHEDYKIKAKTQLALGLDFALLRPAFLTPIQKKKVNKQGNSLLICFGGSDPKNFTEKILRFIRNNSRIEKVNLVLGSEYKYFIELNNKYSNQNNLIFHYDISEIEMCKIMDESQIAIVPSSTIAIEAYSRNSLVITGHTINNQIKNYFGLINFASVFGIGDFNCISINKLNEIINKVCVKQIVVNNQLQKNHRLKQILKEL